ncbi:MAG: IS21-like element helper ATPase IstB [Candidatus Aminicenantales bacterium]
MDKERITSNLKTLSLHTVAQIYEQEAQKAVKTNMTYQGYLGKLVEEEVLCKTDKSINRRIQIAMFPFIKTLEEFDFSFQKSLNEKFIRELSHLNFLEEAKNIIFLGPPGVGKSHLAISLGVVACQKRKRVLFYSTESLMTDLAAADFSGSIQKKLDLLSRIDLLIIDELGYMQMNNASAKLFFQLISKRYEKGSIILTTNKPFEEWGQIFEDEVIAAAILDRLLHHCFPIVIKGKSYRTKDLPLGKDNDSD